MKWFALACAVLLMGCHHTPPQPPAPPPPVPADVAPVVTWTANGEQAVVSWPDMPVVIYGGSEALVLRRQSFVGFQSARIIEHVESFIGVDRGDLGEYHVLVSGLDGVKRYERSEHKASPDECYDAYSDKASLSATPTGGVNISLLARVTGENINPYAHPRLGPLSNFVHFEVTLFLEAQ